MKNIVAPLDCILKDCPFCGRAAKLENTVTEAVIRCTASWCGAVIKRRHAPKGDKQGIDLATDAWNRRTTNGNTW